MAAKASAAVGSAAWIASEKENVLQLLEQEKEEIVYPAQHEVEWLNEHMAEIFSRNQLYVHLTTCKTITNISVTSPTSLRLLESYVGRHLELRESGTAQTLALSVELPNFLKHS